MASNTIDSANQTHRGRPSSYPNFSQEVWDEITAYLLPSSALNATDVFDFKSNAYDRVWTAVFRNEDWLESCSAKDVNIVLIGADLDILSGLTVNKAQPCLVLAAFDRCGELQYKNDLLHLSLRGGTSGLKEHQLEQLTLAIQNLRPIFLLNLNPPTQTLPDSSESPSSDPVQFIFRCFGGPSFWTGRPPLVDVVLSEGWKKSQCEYTFEGFTFKDKKYRQCHRQDTDWTSVAKVESGQDCSVIETV
ncbi:hypothetical protein BU25DRAFT_472378 [Macroventuria anomochaeta]|uniref:Uncharacterized protein n=1 Tax=Macroventuria anomochaeta TaxID=301207 RepID=A0ACB6RWR7_9PLEO|nr:uncharacterized protein BU25DRAFT_472378 [Macroventuria anomochaeta]KAF2626147.1 hypothetical protein BU25DRAFT_472378 [Macroventuria anomochaeta]